MNIAIEHLFDKQEETVGLIKQAKARKDKAENRMEDLKREIALYERDIETQEEHLADIEEAISLIESVEQNREPV